MREGLSNQVRFKQRGEGRVAAATRCLRMWSAQAEGTEVQMLVGVYMGLLGTAQPGGLVRRRVGCRRKNMPPKMSMS